MAFDEQTKRAVWAKGKDASPNDPALWRKDECGAWMNYTQYGNRQSSFGWEIDHITSLDHGGTDALSNLRPLHWENNASKSSGRLVCAVTSNGTQNVSVK